MNSFHNTVSRVSHGRRGRRAGVAMLIAVCAFTGSSAPALAFNPQPDPPGVASDFNPQPDPPGAHAEGVVMPD